MSKNKTKSNYYLSYNVGSLTFPRNIFHAPKMKAAKELADELTNGARVLDAGCGAGYVSAGLSPRLAVTGVDREKEAIVFCKRYRKGTFLVADLKKLPFRDNTFSLILFTNAIEHLEDPKSVLKELKRVLKPGGKMVISTENCASMLWIILENTWYRIFGGPCKPYLKEVHPQRYTEASLKKDLSKYFTLQRLSKEILGMELIAIGTKE